MKAFKHVSILLSFMLLFAIIFPATGAFAAENGQSKAVKNEKEVPSSKHEVKGSGESKQVKDPKKQPVNSKKTDNASTVKKATVQVQQKKQQSTEKPEEKPEGKTEQPSPPEEKPEQASQTEGADQKAKAATVSSSDVNTNKSTQIHLHLDKCTNPTTSVFVEIKGEWKEMTNPGNSPLFKLPDGGEYVKDDVTAFKLVFANGEEMTVPVSELKAGVEAEGTINYWLEDCDATEEEGTSPEKATNRNTQIHLHLKDCVPPASQVFVEVKGEWKVMTNPGKSPLYKLADGGEFVKDDVTAFKFTLTEGGELIVPVSEMKVGTEAEGTINYWLENCEMPIENTFKTLSLKIDESKGKVDSAILVLIDGKRIEFKLVNGVWTIILNAEATLDKIKGIELTSEGQTKLIPISQLAENVQLVDGVLTVQLNWGIQGEIVGEEQNESATPAPVRNTGNGNPPGGSADSQSMYGDVLPQTGESSRMIYYILGLLFAAGGILLRFRNPLKN